jgi:hypothetical protein
MSKQAVLQGLLSKIENVGLKNIMRFCHNWNEAMVQQFYATLEVNHEKETIKWMTGRGKYRASFAQFADVVYLDYDACKQGELMGSLPKANKKSEVAQFYTNPNFEYGNSKYLATKPMVLNKLICCTLMPKIGNIDAIQEKYYVIIRSILDGTKVN